jgi:hypothetical protein
MNNALFLICFSRRINPYTRSCAILGTLFAIGFVLITIVALSLIPIYISQHGTVPNKNIQVASKQMIDLFAVDRHLPSFDESIYIDC